MRIGMFADMYKPHVSGVTNYISMYKTRFEQLGHEVYVFTYGNRSYTDEEVNVIRSPAIAWGNTGWQMGLSLSQEAKKLIPTMDVAHIHHPFLSGRVAIRECGPHRIPLVFTNHSRYDIFADEYAAFLPRNMRMAFLRSYLGAFAKKMDMYLAPSAGIIEWLHEMGIDENVHLHNNVIDTPAFLHPQNPRQRSEFGWTSHEIVFCHLGRFAAEKNIDVLLESYVTLARQEPRSRLLLIGDGPRRADMDAKLRECGIIDSVHFAGSTPYSEVPGLLGVADVFVTASVSETFPLVLMEAAAAGLALIGVSSPGVSDIIADGETGFLATNSSTDLAEKLGRLASDDSLRQRMKAAARQSAERFDIKPMADKLLSHYEAHIASRRSAS